MKRILNLFLAAVLAAGLTLYAAPYTAVTAEENDTAAAVSESEEPAEEGSGAEDEAEAAEQTEEDYTETDGQSAGSDEDPEDTDEQADAETAPDTVIEADTETGTGEDADTEAAAETGDEAEEDPVTDELTVEEEKAPSAEEETGAEEALEIADEEETDSSKIAAAGEDGKTELASAVLSKQRLVYTGAARTQTKSAVVTAVVDGEEQVLTLYKDYSVSYKNNVNVGIATMIFTGKGKYTGTIEKTFRIIPPSSAVSSFTPGTKCFVVKWKKQTEQVRGYHLQYGLKSDFSDKTNIFIKDSGTAMARVTGLASGKKYYVRIRTFLTVDGENYYSNWSAAKTISLTYNTIKVTGSGTTRTVTLMNPKNSVKTARIAVWSVTNDRDDKKWYTMKKSSDGSWKATMQTGYLKHYGECTVKCFTGSTLLDDASFSVSKADYLASKNTVLTGGSGYTRNIRLIHPSGIKKNVTVAVWSEEGGQDDLVWYDMEKQSDGTWLAVVSTLKLAHGGTINAHVYTNSSADFIKGITFSCKLMHADITWDTGWEFAGYSKIHTGTAKLYRATKNRKGIVVGVNAGHGTILPSGQDNYVYSHPDKTPKTTGGSTAAGNVWTICDNTGMTFNDGTPEAHVTLAEALILKEVLLDAGYDVIMLREDNDSGLDVIARTVICNELADCHISIHWDGDGLGYDKGIFFMSVADGIKGMYPTSTIWQESDKFGNCVIQGMRQKGLPIFEGGSMQMDLMQTSYSKVPSIDIELGNQTSSHTTSDLTARAYGMLAGLNIYFGQE